MQSKTVFFTGFPGFIGTRIVEKLIVENDTIKIYALVLKSVLKSTNEILERNAHLKKKIELIVGDVSKPNLDLSTDLYTKLTNETTEIFHLAAIYNLEVPKNVAWKVNVIGTNNMLKFALKCLNLSVFIFFSSIVAVGKVKGDVFEDKLETNCEFHFNHYEQTKFASEILIRKYMDRLPIIIIRPGAVVGESKTGITDKFDGFYYALSFASILKLFPIWLPHTHFNVPMVPVDYIAEATCYVSTQEDCIGHCFHLGEFELTANQFLAYICDKDETGTKIRIPSALLEFLIKLPVFKYIFLRNRFIKFIMKKGFQMPPELLEAADSYNFCLYRTDNRKFLERAGIFCPKFKTYVKNIMAFYNKNRKNPLLLR
ncbi:MAG TPA: SDR family oxidoreductase [Candidatus Deferrimicrobium sp.]|nr:SDR family oxidoreductase [Candidatus Deferrimicrobium sp.]